MIRKTFLFAALLFLTIFSTSAQQAVGEWNLFTTVSGSFDNIIDTPKKVYYTSANRLFSFDKESNETYAYNTMNRLSDTNVTAIKYNPEGGYLFVAYDTGNIDLIYDDGHLVNMSDIKDASLTSTKSINGINFAGGRIYLATDFGIVIYDDEKHHVIESGIFNIPIQAVAPVGDFLLIARYSGATQLYYAPLDGHHNTLDKFTLLGGIVLNWMEVFGDNLIYYSPSEKVIRIIEFSSTTGEKPTVKNNSSMGLAASVIPKPSTNGYYTTTASEIIYFGEDGKIASRIAIPEALRNQTLTSWNGLKSVWGADSEGIANYNISDGAVTVLSDKFLPEGIVTDMVAYLKFDKLGRLWMSNIGSSRYRGVIGDFHGYPQKSSRVNNDGSMEDVGVYPASAHNSTPKGHQTRNNDLRMYGGLTRFAIDPENPNRYYQGNMIEGLYVIEDGKEIHKFYWENSPFIGGWGSSLWDVNFDPDGNLWAGMIVNSSYYNKLSPYYVLPKEKLRGDLSTLTADDWNRSQHYKIEVGNKDMGSLMCTKSPVMLSFNSAYENPLVVTLTKGTWANTDDDEIFELIQPLDQDGKAFVPTHITCAVEDKRGRVWIGSSSGIVEIANPATLTPSSRITRIKVPRNDGTNYADYLCETDQINDIAIDPSNRKWIATNASGAYLVSENGDKILEHFTTDNSPFADNCILSVACDPNSNTVYFGTPTGLLSYSATSSPAAEDYSDVYAYPNPVRPDYTGYITITNLMDNSLVKITDAAGHVVFQTRSEGGMAIWDGLDSNHNRVKSGVYYVFASQNENSSSSGAVTKILVVR